MALFQAMVKSVLSGDTVVLHNINNPKQERVLSLAFVSAPRLRREGDEPFAFESRDFLRNILVGKVVQFRVLYTIPTGAKRDYGIVTLPGGLTLPDTAVAEGWVKLRGDADRKDDSEASTMILQRLEVLEARARADSKGLWAETGGQLDTAYELPDPKAFVEQNRGAELNAIVEKVLSGDRLIARLLLSPSKHVQTMVLVAGIRAPSTKRVNPSDGKEQPAEPFGDEAQQFIETRLLQRNIKFIPLGVNPQNQLIGTVAHPLRGNVAPYLLESGLARCMDQHSTLLGGEMGKLRQAERKAKEQRLGVFQGHVSARPSAGEVEAVVSRVQSADTLYLRNKAGLEKRINLSSVRQPKTTDPKQAPWQAEAKEFLRKRLIGKHVKVVIDGKRPPQDGFDEREMATVTHNGKNVALLLVENGYGSVIRHRADDADRSSIYDDLLLAEDQAQKEQKGIWSSKSPATKPFVDYSESLEKAKRQLTLLSRQKKVPAIVDFVKSGSRFTVLVPRENAKLTFVLSGIRAPKSARNPNEKSEPFGQEAHDFANKRCLQRDVEIDVEDCDKVGGFIGTLYVNRESFAKLLVEEGLASVHAYSAEKSGNAKELFAAEQKAKEGRKGMWHSWDPSQDVEEDESPAQTSNGTNGDAAAAERRKDYRDVMVTHVEENGRLKLQEIGSGTAELTNLMERFRNFHLDRSNDKPLSQFKVGDFVSARFSEDNDWYRARIRRHDRENKKVEVVYVDYGNSETLPYSSLRPLDAKFSTTSLRPQATEAVLSFVQFPSEATPDYLRDAVSFVGELTNGVQLVANIDNVVDGAWHVTLFYPESETKDHSINAEVVGEGLARVPLKLRPWERAATDVLPALKAREDEAKAERRGMWEYGDLTED